MSDIRAYLHGHYDGDKEERKRQQQDDARRSIEVKREIVDTQNAVFEYETEALSHEMEEQTKEQFEELCRNYNTTDKYKEYLVDGAVLQCTKATMEDFKLPGGKKIILERSEYDDENARVQMVLHVRENGMDDQGRCYATVKDCVQGINIFWPACNCMMPADREEEKKRIEQDKECSKFGVCRHLMQLNEKWDNMPLYGLKDDLWEEDRTYMTKRNVYVKDGAPKMDIEDIPEEYLESEDAEGITMTSVLFCKHGGLICPVTSGQENIFPINMEERIQELIAGVEGKPVNSQEEMFALSTMEILSRLIYQEAARKCGSGQNAVLFSLVNRLFTGTNVIHRTKANNLYSIITGSGQYESVLKKAEYEPNSYKPPIEINSNDKEIIAWENAKRLAAILYIAIEDYGKENEYDSANDRDECVVEKEDKVSYQQVVDFIESQTDTEGNRIINEIGTRESLVAGNSNKDQGIYIGGNTFYWQ